MNLKKKKFNNQDSHSSVSFNSSLIILKMFSFIEHLSKPHWMSFDNVIEKKKYYENKI